MKQKIFTLLFAVVASIGTISASDTQVDGIWYDFDETAQTASVTYRGDRYNSYRNEYSGNVVIPESVTHNNVVYSVTSIGNHAFEDCSSLTSVTIPNSVTSIGSSAFYGCSSLIAVYISDLAAWCNIYFSYDNHSWGRESYSNPLKYAHNLYLNGELLTDLVIPNSVTSIRDYAFSGCSSLTSVTIPNSITSIGYETFYNCTGLTSVTIPNSVTSIGSSAFYGCSSLPVIDNVRYADT